MKFRSLILSAFAAYTTLAVVSARADSMASIAVAPATGAVTLNPRWGLGGDLAGFHYMAQDLSLGGGPTQFYSITAAPVPSGGDPLAGFTIYVASSGAATHHADIGSKLTPNSYSALTSADPNIAGYGPVNLYTIHHKGTTDYLTAIIPSSGTASAVTDERPMSGPGDASVATGVGGYFGLTFAADNLTYGENLFYYLRTFNGTTRFGAIDGAHAGVSSDKFDLGISGHNALAYTSDDVGFGQFQMYYLRLDPITGFTIFGTLNPISGRAADVANLGSVFSTLTYVPGAITGIGSTQFYTAGSVNAQWQSVSFAAIADRAISAGSFTVAPSASSTLPIALTVVPGSIGAASITGPVAGVFTVSPTAPGLITLQATQAGQLGSFEYNMLRQSFTASGVATLVITTQPTSQSAVTGTTANFSVVASGTTTVSYQWRKAGANITGNASATTATLTLTNVQAGDAANYDVVVTDAAGSISSDVVALTVTDATPVITNSPLTAAGTVDTPFSFTITASGSPTSYTATPLPDGLSIVEATGAITGTPTTVGTTHVLLGATNTTGTGHATLTITVAAAGVAPIITNSPLTAAGTVDTPFSFTITASGTPTSYTATPLPDGLSIAAATGVITGTPTTVGTTHVLLGATNTTGTGHATLRITVAAAGVAPIITNDPLTAAGTVGTPFSFTITASGTPTSYTASPLPAGLSIVAATGAITGTPTTMGTTHVLLGATNTTGTGNATLTITVAAAGVAPIITNSPLTAAGTVGTPFSFTITATGTPTSYAASPLPGGLSIVAATGVITGTPTTVGTISVLLGATNAIGTGHATLIITVAAVDAAPIITNDPLTAAGTVGTPFSFTITATGTPTSYAASPLPGGLGIVTATGVITGTPTTVGTISVLLGATNAIGTGHATLIITVAAVDAAPIITNDPLTATGTVGTPFSFTITATGLPTRYGANPLPAGLSIVTATGAITGTPTTAGSTTVTLRAFNSFGTGRATLTITIADGVAPIITNDPLTAHGVFGMPFSFTITASGSPTSFSAFNLPPGVFLDTVTGVISGTPSRATTTYVTLTATNDFGSGDAVLMIVIAPSVVAPMDTTVVQGDGATFTAGPNDGAPLTYQWQKNGVDVPGATDSSLTIGDVQPVDVGYYAVVITSNGHTTTTVPALLEMLFTGKIAGTATEVGSDIHHPNGNIYDQILLTGTAASVKADPGQVVRVSYVDLNDDIVQVEFNGAGSLTVALESSSGPAAPVNYNQPDVAYMKGHASISVTGADATTHLAVFSVGRSNAMDQALFRDGTNYDGWADIALVTVASADASFGGLFTANASYFSANGMTGVYAPGVQFSGPLYVSDIDAANTAKAFLLVGSVTDARITGGDLFQDGGGDVEVAGITELQFTDGMSSGGTLLPAQANRGRLVTDGVDVTDLLVP